MKRCHIKQIKKCFGNKTKFFKDQMPECLDCQFQRQCFLHVNKISKDENDINRNVYIVNNLNNDMINTKEVINVIKKEEHGLNLTELVSKTKFSRGQIRIAVAFLLGTGKIKEKEFGKMRLFYIKKKANENKKND